MFVKGIILSSYGVNGYAKIKSISNGFNDFFNLKGNKLVLKKECCSSVEVRVENVSLIRNSLLLKFEEFNTPEAIKDLIGFELWVGDEFASKLEEGEYYFGKLIGYELVNSGKALGVVVSFLESGESIFLEVKVGSKLFFIPFLDVYLGDIDRSLKTIELKVLELLE
ncbi:16S rRNA processing protein RimM [Borrelia miyamotoi]|uniref:Ribosome maturation factor RimM n=1 Tax=Borrelia miyamotoi TaxID=47466 RepID=A0AAX3JM14_9SPIR|nr:ribosome maturation factor RimM [Borrelia miyamotoi]QFP41678.1 16S rRNA processing protein RimM [Borrelia miyamotoi]QFP47798.1 ribosome maturation factor RimM [Borrelia miyamotoi]QGT55557.1 16S rRNA processing protein RimM [Borrelia miyamotoi]QGT56341.1 16S rRNA processing protein RimM [Borrelia miyamotoi]WAZ71588.1 ribosome maturation factor RimM [Borrelia miyamotoi]